MNKCILGAVVLGIALIGVTYSHSDTNSNETAAAAVASPITVEADTHDFGTIDIFGGKVRTTYTLTNAGTEDVTILDGVTSCMCTEGEIDGLRFGMHGSQIDSVTIPAGSSKEVIAIFDPLAHGPNGTGPIKRQLLLHTNSEQTPEVELSFSGNVVKQ